MLARGTKVEKLTARLQKVKQEITQLQRETMNRRVDLFFLKEQSKRKKLKDQNLKDEKRLNKLQHKVNRLEMKLQVQTKKEVVDHKEKGISELKGIDLEITKRKMLLEGYMHQIITIKNNEK